MKSDQSKKATRIIFLDYLRIFAFISVLVGHKFYQDIVAITMDDHWHATPKLILGLLYPFVWHGGAGVIVFFLISGYIISQVLTIELPVSFMVRRIFRIYPLYIVAVFMQVIIEPGNNFPELGVLIKQLSLMGDFFGTPHTLSGVEWTLRVEIIFYVFMAVIKACGFWGDAKSRSQVVYFLMCLTVGMSFLPAFPDVNGFARGYFLIYAPFLFIGAGFWLYEAKEIKFWQLILLVGLVFMNCFYLTSKFSPVSLDHHFAVLGFMLFAAAWRFRERFQNAPIVLLLSNLTYSVYLFHDWLFDLIKNYFMRAQLSILWANLSTLAVLFVFCFLMHKIFERPANMLGRKLSSFV